MQTLVKSNSRTTWFIHIQVKEVIMAECGCGRSPNGNCVGWHNLTEEQYLEKKTAYEEKTSVK